MMEGRFLDRRHNDIDLVQLDGTSDDVVYGCIEHAAASLFVAGALRIIHAD